MGGRRARRLCPEALVVPPRWSAYVEASKAVFGVFERTSPLVEGLSIDEAFLDARGLERIQGSPEEIAVALRREVRDRVGLPITVGVATTKFLAKVASAVAKPDGLLVVPAGGERAFLEPLPVEALWGVGPATAARLRARGLARVGDVARLGEEGLVAILGVAAGRHLHHLAHNRDPRPVRAGRRRRSVGSQCALNFASRPPGEIDRTLVALVDRVTRRMRRSGHAGRTVVLRLRFGDYSRASRSRTLPDATAATRAVLETARELLEEARPTIESGASPSWAWRSPTSPQTPPSSRCPCATRVTTPSTRRWTASATASAPSRSRAPRWAAATAPWRRGSCPSDHRPVIPFLSEEPQELAHGLARRLLRDEVTAGEGAPAHIVRDVAPRAQDVVDAAHAALGAPQHQQRAADAPLRRRPASCSRSIEAPAR